MIIQKKTICLKETRKQSGNFVKYFLLIPANRVKQIKLIWSSACDTNFQFDLHSAERGVVYLSTDAFPNF